MPIHAPPSPFSKIKFNLKSDRVNLVASARVLLSVCFIYPMCPSDTIKTGTGKVDPVRKFKCTTAATFEGYRCESGITVITRKLILIKNGLWTCWYFLCLSDFYAKWILQTQYFLISLGARLKSIIKNIKGNVYVFLINPQFNSLQYPLSDQN